MKTLFTFLLAIFTAMALAQEPQGTMTNVELLSGTKQRAQFLGIVNDTVQLGGYIKNQFTIVRIHKDKFKSITDEQGHDLLHPEIPGDTLVKDSAVAPVAAQPDTLVTDSLKPTASADSTRDSTGIIAAVQTPEVDSISAPKEAPATFTLSSDSVLVAFTGNCGDSTLSPQITALTERLFQENGEKVQIVNRREITDCDDDICIQGKLSALGARTIYFGKLNHGTSPDSIAIELSRVHFAEELPEIYRAQMSVSRKFPIGDAIKDNRLSLLIQASKGIAPQAPKPKISFISVESDPDGASVSRAEKDAICKTPCTFAVTDTGRIVLNTYWSVGSQLWGAQSAIKPIPGDTAKISIKLKPIKPEIFVTTTPADAEIFPGTESITKRSESIGKTPNKFVLTEPGMANITLRRMGYKDTVVTFYVAPVSKTKIDVEMERLTDFNELSKQQQWKKERNMLRLGHVIMAASIAPVIVGGIFTYLANKDYDDAKDIKNELQMPGSVNGNAYQEKVQENRDLVDSGDRKVIIGGSLIGTGIVLFGIGLFFTF